MGSCFAPTPHRQLSESINGEIDIDRKHVSTIQKILFLGSGGSGKSTLFKQLRIIHGSGFNDLDREGYIKHIHLQIINEMRAIIRIYIDYNHRKQQVSHKVDDDCSDSDSDELLIFDRLNLSSPKLADMESADLILNYRYDKNKQCLRHDISSAIKALWNEAVIKEIYDLRNITRIETSSAYFWDKLDEIQDSNFLPSTQDILLNRVVTTGLNEQSFDIDGNILHIIDVGGQRSQRRKWIHCFEYVVAVIFIASLSCYDAILDEDLMVNQMTDQLELFDNIINTFTLRNVAMIVFLNKRDLFKEKYCIQKVPLDTCSDFEDYPLDDAWDYGTAVKYIKEKFEAVDRSRNRQLFTHFTCATDKNNIQKVFADVQEIIVSDSLIASGLLN